MKIQIALVLLLGLIQSTSAQIENTKEALVSNKVKSTFEQHCISGSNSSCTAIWEKFDKKGNSVEWNMGRLATRYRTIYDGNNNKIFTLWVDKTDTTQIDSIPYVYDENNQLTQNGDETIENFYNQNNQLIKQISASLNLEGNTVRKIRTIDWTSLHKIKTKNVETEIIETTKPTKYRKTSTSRVEYEYDDNTNLSKETHFRDDVVTNTIVYKYDSSNRLTEKREKNISRINSINRMKYGNHDDISELTTRISYNENGSIHEKYTYFSDPCMSLDNHYLFKHFYLDNGLLERADVYEENELVFTISYEYEHYE